MNLKDTKKYHKKSRTHNKRTRLDDVYAAASFVAVGSVVSMAIIMTSFAVEAVFFAKSGAWWLGRLVVMRFGNGGFDTYLLSLIGALITFGAGLVAERLDRKLEWHLIVYLSIWGIAAGILGFMFFNESCAEFLATNGEVSWIASDLQFGLELDDVNNRVRNFSIGISIWFCLQIFRQFGLRKPENGNIPVQP